MLDWALRLAAVALLGSSLVAFGMTLLAALGLSSVVALLLRRPDQAANFVTLAVTFFVMALLAEVALRVLPLSAQYYRPHEMLSWDGEFYLRNRRIDRFASPHGDIAAWPGIPKEVRQPREISFVTDSLGLRNYTAYDGQPFVAIGDSFVVANGTDQDDTLPSVLTREYGVDTYNAGYPSDPKDYPRLYRVAIGDQPDPGRAIVLIFEGNDLPCADDARTSRRNGPWYRYVPGEFRRLEIYRFSYGLINRALVQLRASEASGFVREVGGKPIAFHRAYVEASKAESGEACAWEEGFAGLAAMSESIALLLFVPTKYRVYAPLIEDELDGPLPRFRPDFVAAFADRHRIPYLDLTESLVSAAERSLGLGRFVYWRDDTHWGPDGIRAAAAEIAARLPSAHR